MNTLLKLLAEQVTRLTLENIELQSKVIELQNAIDSYLNESSNVEE